jgi:hypothetical protein
MSDPSSEPASREAGLGEPEYKALGIFNPVFFALQRLPVRLA